MGFEVDFFFFFGFHKMLLLSDVNDCLLSVFCFYASSLDYE